MDAIQMLSLPFLACLLLTTILGYLGMHVLNREIIFIDIALAQIAAVGAVTAHIFFAAHGDSVLGYTCALGATFLAAAFFAFARKSVAQIPLEAVIGVTYAIAAGATLLMVGTATGSHIHVQQILAGSILWTRWCDILACLIAFSVVGLCFYVFRKPFNRITEDYDRARRAGLKVVYWDFFFYALFGIVITLSVRIAGVVVVFAFLIIPATISALFARRSAIRLAIAWGSGIAASAMGLLFSYRYDFSVGPSVALFLGLLLTGAALYRVWIDVMPIASARGSGSIEGQEIEPTAHNAERSWQ